MCWVILAYKEDYKVDCNKSLSDVEKIVPQ